MKDFYYILGITSDCPVAEVREAYRKLSKKFHPDLNQNDKYFEGRFREVQEAYEVLSDPVKRVQYDHDLGRLKSNHTHGSGSQYQPKNSSINKSRTRMTIDIGFTIVLIIITIVFGAYVKKAVSDSKAVKLTAAPVVAIVPATLPKHHKKRHYLKFNNAAFFQKAKSDTTTTHTYKPIPVVNKIAVHQLKIVAHKNNSDSLLTRQITAASAAKNIDHVRPVQPVSSSVKGNDANGGILYSTYIRSNITGVTNLKQSDNYSSAVVKAIPGNSKVFVLERGVSYYKVRFNNDVGYVPKWTVEIK